MDACMAVLAANASNTVRNAITSVRSLTDVTQDGGSRWSADCWYIHHN